MLIVEGTFLGQANPGKFLDQSLQPKLVIKIKLVSIHVRNAERPRSTAWFDPAHLMAQLLQHPSAQPPDLLLILGLVLLLLHHPSPVVEQQPHPTIVGPISEAIFGQTLESSSSDPGGFSLSPIGPVPLPTGEFSIWNHCHFFNFPSPQLPQLTTERVPLLHCCHQIHHQKRTNHSHNIVNSRVSRVKNVCLTFIMLMIISS